jgi:hypothetical protein
VREELIGRSPRGMAHLQKPSCGYELATVPPRYRSVHGEKVYRRGKSRQQGETYQLTTDLLKMSSHSSVTISLMRLLSTAEKSSVAA